MNRLCVLTASLLFLLPVLGQATAARFGEVDADELIARVSARLSLDASACYELQGSARVAALGRQASHGPAMDWPEAAEWRSMRRYLDLRNGVLIDEVEREPGRVPADWRFGAGWLGGRSLQTSPSPVFVTTPEISWTVDGSRAFGISDSVHRGWRLDVWLNPMGFLHLARTRPDSVRAFWRWELEEMGRDGPTVVPRKVYVLVVRLPTGQYANATIDEDYVVRRLQARTPDPVLGDMNFENEFLGPDVPSPAAVRMPAVWHHHQGWDDDRQAQSVTTGHNAFHGVFSDVRPVPCRAIPGAPEGLEEPPGSMPVTADALGDGVTLVSSRTHNSLLVEFDDYNVVLDAPLDERRSLAVLDAMYARSADKPLRYAVALTHHYDHIGGLRTFVHAGATVISHASLRPFLQTDVINYDVRALSPDLLALAPPTELAEGNIYETFEETYVVADDRRRLHLYYVQPFPAVEGMIMAYLPEQRLLYQADLVDNVPGAAGGIAGGVERLVQMVEVLGLEVTRVVPAHGPVMNWADVLALAVPSARAAGEHD